MIFCFILLALTNTVYYILISEVLTTTLNSVTVLRGIPISSLIFIFYLIENCVKVLEEEKVLAYIIE